MNGTRRRNIVSPQQPAALQTGGDEGKCFPEEQGELNSPGLDEEAQKLQARLTASLI